MVATNLITAEELLALPDDGQNHELIDGELTTMAPDNVVHGASSAPLFFELVQFVRAHRLGHILNNVGFIISRDPDTVLAPDIAFVARDRMPSNWRETPFPAIAPDLAVEVISPSSTTREMNDKIRRYFAAGARLIWIVDPYSHQITVHEPDRTARTVIEGEMLTGGDVLPGFAVALADLFAWDGE